ncbi:MAG: branched-chain amino acid ABC transporter permease [Deltaproteobacteria bacterium]|nr:branched-chain amino acid ABC transporter permease [Deltaproteobacteria bacterium]
MELFLQTLLNGLTTGALYCCIAVGFSLIFGIIQLIYFAQCEMAMVGAFIFAGILTGLSAHVPFPLALIIAVALACICAAVVSCIGQLVLLYPVRNAAKVKGLIVSLGFSIILQNIVLLWISPNDLVFPLLNSQRWVLGGVTITGAQLWVVFGSLSAWAVVWALLYLTRTGRCIRAVAQSRDGALLMGIRVNHIVSATFALAAMTASIAGILMGLYSGQIRFDMGFVPGIKGFMVAILGGVGNIKGALVAGLLLGVTEGLLAGYLSSEYRDVYAFMLLILVFLFRPQGILGEGT